jgi:putative redox protein
MTATHQRRRRQVRAMFPATQNRFAHCSSLRMAYGPGQNGFRPHELLEPALASCMNMWLRIYADNHQVPLEGVSTAVALKRDQPGVTVFEYEIALQGPLTPEQKDKLVEIAQTCPVRKTLSGTMSFSSAAPIDRLAGSG